MVEWHPTVLKFEIDKTMTEGDYRAFNQIKASIEDPQERKDFEEWYKNEMAIEYWMQRQEASDNSWVYRGKEVVLARDPKELYDLVISKYGENVPSMVNTFVVPL